MKALLLLFVFIDGQPAGQFDPIMVEDMQACEAAYKDDIGPTLTAALPEGGTLKGICVTLDDIKVLAEANEHPKKPV